MNDDLAIVLEAAERALDLRKVIGSGANLQEECDHTQAEYTKALLDAARGVQAGKKE